MIMGTWSIILYKGDKRLVLKVKLEETHLVCDLEVSADARNDFQLFIVLVRTPKPMEILGANPIVPERGQSLQGLGLTRLYRDRMVRRRIG